MARQTILVRGTPTTVNWDRLAEAAAGLPTYRGLAYGVAVDETTGMPLTPGRDRLQVRLDAASLHRGLVAQAGGDGAAGIAGAVAWTHSAVLALTADGFLPFDETLEPPLVPVPIGPARILGEFPLRRLPVALAGRVTRRGVALAGVRVEATEYAPRTPRGTRPGEGAVFAPARAVFAIAVPLMLSAARVRSIRISAIAGALGVLSASADRGARCLEVRGAPGLAALTPGQLLAFADAPTEPGEWLRIAAVQPGPTPDFPVVFQLDAPLAHQRRVGAGVSGYRKTGADPWSNLVRDTCAGDTLLFTEGAAALAGGNSIELGSASGTVLEVRRLEALRATTNLQGEYRLPPMHRVALVKVTATEPGPPLPPPGMRTATLTQRLDYDVATNRLNIELP